MMELHKYPSYDDYRRAQVKANNEKINNVFVKEIAIEFICDILMQPDGGRILCHGVRNGAEVDYFKKYLPMWSVIGTEIAPSTHPAVVEWDFHDPRPDWLEQFDIIYSNSWDHSYDPYQSLATWRGQLKPGGCMVIEWTPSHNRSDETDPFAATAEEYEDIFKAAGLNIWIKAEREKRIYYFLRKA